MALVSQMFSGKSPPASTFHVISPTEDVCVNCNSTDSLHKHDGELYCSDCLNQYVAMK